GGATIASLPSLAYVLSMVVLGAFGPMYVQLTTGAPVYGRPLLDMWFSPHDARRHAALLAVLAILVTGRRLAIRWRWSTVDLAARLCISALVVAIPLASGLGADNSVW